MKRGKLIVFEGVSGTGKETQAKLLAQDLTKRGVKSRIVYHPSPELKDVLHDWRKNRNIDHVSEAYFLLADRYNRVEQIINPALKRGEWIISLRNWVSALVYQAKTPKERAWIAREFARFEPKPKVLFFFDITPEEAINRIMKRHNETGEALGKFETRDQLGQKLAAYHSVLKTIDHIRIDATDSIENIHTQIVNRVV